MDDPQLFATEIRKEIYETTRCTASAGVAGNMLMARLATRKAKPNGQCYISYEMVPFDKLGFFFPLLINYNILKVISMKMFLPMMHVCINRNSDELIKKVAVCCRPLKFDILIDSYGF